MPAHRKSRRFTIIVTLLGISLVAALGAYLFLRQPKVQNYLAQNLTRWLGLKINAQHIGIDLNRGLAIQAREVQFRLPGEGGHLSAEALSVGLKIGPLLRGQLAPQWIILQHPRLHLSRSPWASPGDAPPAEDPESGSNRPAGSPLQVLPATLSQVRLSKGILEFDDLPYRVGNLDLELRIDPAAREITRGQASFDLTNGLQTARLVLAGSVRLGETWGETRFNPLQVEFKKLPLGWFPWPGFLPCDSGRATGRVTLNGDPGQGIEAQGRLNVEELRLRLQRGGRQHGYDVAYLPLDLQTHWQAGRWSIAAASPDKEIFPLAVDWLWDFTPTPRPAMDLKVVGGPMPLAQFKALYPAPVTPPWLDQKLFPALAGGTVDLREFRIHGRLDQLGQLKNPLHRDRLKLDLDLNRTTVFGERPGLPLQEISARVLIEQGQLRISDLTGGFGDSRIGAASFGIRDLYHAPLTVEGNLEGALDLRDIYAQTAAPWFPAPARRLFAPLAAAQGPVRATTDFRIRCVDPPVTTLSGTFDLGPAQLEVRALDPPLQLKGGRLSLHESGGTDFEAQGSLADSEFSISGHSTGGLVSSPSAKIAGWEARIAGIFDLPTLLAGRNRGVLLSFWPELRDNGGEIRGEVLGDFQIEKSAQTEGPRIRQGTFLLREGCLDWEQSPWAIEVDSGELNLAPGVPAQLSGAGKWGPNSWRARGGIDDFQDSRRRTLKLEISGAVDLPQLVDTLFPHSPLKVASPSPLAARVALTHSARGLFLQGETELGGVALTHGEMSALLADPRSRSRFQIERTLPGRYQIPRITLESGASQVNLKGWLTPGSSDSLGFIEVSADPFDLKALELRLSPDGDILEGLLQLHTSWRLKPEGIFPAGPEGVIRLRGLGVFWPKLSRPIRNGSLELRLNREALRIASGRLQMGQSALNITGRITGWMPLKGALEIRGAAVRVADLHRPRPSIPKGATRKPVTPSAPRLPPWMAGAELKAEIAIETLRGDQFTSGPLEVGLTLTKDILALQRLILDLRPGTFILTGRIPNAPRDAMRFGGYIRGEKIPTAPLMGLVGVEPDRLAAQLGLEGSYVARGLSRKSLIQGLNGNFSMELSEGSVNRSNILFRILDLLSLQNLVLQRMPEIGESAFFFNKAAADIEIRNGVATTDNFTLRSPVFNAAGRGTLDLVRGEIDFDLGAQPLGSVDNLVSWIPIVGHILTGPEKALLVYYFHITGPLQSPQLQHVPFKNLGSGLVGYFERIFTTPPRLLRKAADFAREFLRMDEEASEGDPLAGSSTSPSGANPPIN